MALFYFDRYSEGMLGKILIAVAVLSGVALFVVTNATTPQTAGALGVLSVFVLSYFLLLSLFTFLIHGISRGVAFFTKTTYEEKSNSTFGLRRSYYYSTIIALAPVIIMSMQSVGEVGIYELGLIGILIALGCLYVTKRTA